MHYTLKVSESELDVVRLALGRMVEAKPIIERKPSVSHVPPEFSTGNDALDAFMRDHWRPSDRAAADKRANAHKPSAKSLAFPFGCKQLTTKPARDVRRFNEDAVSAWRRRGHVVIVERVEGSNGTYVALDGRNVRVLPLGVTA